MATSITTTRSSSTLAAPTSAAPVVSARRPMGAPAAVCCPRPPAAAAVLGGGCPPCTARLVHCGARVSSARGFAVGLRMRRPLALSHSRPRPRPPSHTRVGTHMTVARRLRIDPPDVLLRRAWCVRGLPGCPCARVPVCTLARPRPQLAPGRTQEQHRLGKPTVQRPGATTRNGAWVKPVCHTSKKAAYARPNAAASRRC